MEKRKKRTAVPADQVTPTCAPWTLVERANLVDGFPQQSGHSDALIACLEADCRVSGNRKAALSVGNVGEADANYLADSLSQHYGLCAAGGAIPKDW